MSGTYLFVGAASRGSSVDSRYSQLKSELTESQKLCGPVTLLDVPQNLKFGTFDSLIKLVDELAKFDSQIEGVLRRIERQAAELDPDVSYCVIKGRQQVGIAEYVSNFAWDDSRYPRNKSLADNAHALYQGVLQADEDLKTKSQSYADIKQQHQQLSRKEGQSHLNRDLVEVLTPEVVTSEDFVQSEHLVTVIAVMPRAVEKEFLQSYQSYHEYIVPESAKKLVPDDKEGNALYRVILFKSALEAFRTKCRQLRITLRDFSYDPSVFESSSKMRANVDSEMKRRVDSLRKLCLVAFSEVLCSWCHLKCMRLFVECLLRFGVPADFQAFCLPLTKQGLNKLNQVKTVVSGICASGSKARSDAAGSGSSSVAGIALGIAGAFLGFRPQNRNENSSAQGGAAQGGAGVATASSTASVSSSERGKTSGSDTAQGVERVEPDEEEMLPFAFFQLTPLLGTK